MLKELNIRNFALISELTIDFSNGFSVITGETGAGKSIILGALGLLLGNRADSKAVREGTQKCTVEGHFSISAYSLKPFFDDNDIDFDSEECILRREISASGKSRAFINDSPVSLAVIRQLGIQLIDIHSQHQNLLLEQDQFQLSVVDIVAGSQSALSAYQTCFANFHKAERMLRETEEAIERERENADFLNFQFNELHNLHLQEGEEEELEAKANTMQHAEDIKTALSEAESHLDAESTGIISRLRAAGNALEAIARVFPKAEELAQRISECSIELKDILSDVRYHAADIDFDPQLLDSINTHLDAIYSLEKKHHVSSVTELIAIRTDLEQKLQQVSNSDDLLTELRSEVAAARSKAEKAATRLTKERTRSVNLIEKHLHDHLILLGLPNVRFKVTITPKPLSKDGADQVEFLFSANPGTPLRPVADIASGGEIARVMLSLKALIGNSVKLPTIIFDEIDTGVSGKVAEQMATIMQQMGRTDRQVISITHLPQIAAMGQHHYKVQKHQTKDDTTTTMRLLTAEERIQEIAQMLSGSTITPAALENARTLIGGKE